MIFLLNRTQRVQQRPPTPVLNGTAVFTYDKGGGLDADGNFKSQGKNVDTIDDSQKKLAFVQELLNQVAPRKRSVSNYTLIKENGVYDTKTYTALKIFKDSFNLGVNDKVGSYGPSGGYSSDPTLDNTTNTFRKLMKDYNKRQSGTNSWLIDGATGDSWLYKVIDKETLVGQVERISNDNADYRINFTIGNVKNDTGLYELYKNVVIPYTDEMIYEADRYAGTLDFPDPGEKLPTDKWYGRNGEGPDVHGEAMSYSFGGKMSVEGFNEQVARAPGCKADSTSRRTIMIYENNLFDEIDIATPAVVSQGPDSIPGVDSGYKGNLDRTCEMGTGSDYKYKYAGLRQHEKLSSTTHEMWGLVDPETAEQIIYDPPKTTAKLEQYSPTYWAGIDCSGLTQRSITKANKLEIPGVTSEVKDLGNLGSCPVDDKSCKPCGDPSIWSQDYMPNYARSIGNAADKAKADVLKKVRKGDVVIYPHHVALVHSDRAECKGDDCSYEIIHAYGGDKNGQYTYPDHDTTNAGVKVFGRKVIKTWENISTPTGFGRIKLWD